MALKGKFTDYKHNSGKTEEKTYTVSYPSNLPEGHPNYDKRGTEEDVTQTFPIYESKVYNDVYVNISQVTVHRRFSYASEEDAEADKKTKYYDIQFTYWIYESEEKAKTADGHDYMFREVIDHYGYDGDHSKLFEFAYNSLNNLKGFEELVSDE